MEIIEQAKAILLSRKRAYMRTFDAKNQDDKFVLKDLAKFCRADDTTFLPDARAHAVLEGRREVWLRISKYLNLTPDELWEIYRKD